MGKAGLSREGNNNERWVTVSVAADYLGVSDDTARREADNGRLVSYRRPNGYRQILWSSVESLAQTISAREAQAQHAQDSSSVKGRGATIEADMHCLMSLLYRDFFELLRERGADLPGFFPTLVKRHGVDPKRMDARAEKLMHYYETLKRVDPGRSDAWAKKIKILKTDLEVARRQTEDQSE